ncbi:hypothetical protein AR158_c640R [Paramecium bursaria Chlorella virus AR158]|uniref:hypothetical protein n=1 Tax=Paramecium bursaria Chlorella virus AR158 TaxID=380598 RepID=UPI00015AA7FF|nr:hypothetical protein AR158_c640R [Paramecium bursaria Chlorella virus AR158]ABU44185.1 hypothetical protein AR158_c640R [Paramecium bursaria Chlorella virus AR158]
MRPDFQSCAEQRGRQDLRWPREISGSSWLLGGLYSVATEAMGRRSSCNVSDAQGNIFGLSPTNDLIRINI